VAVVVVVVVVAVVVAVVFVVVVAVVFVVAGGIGVGSGVGSENETMGHPIRLPIFVGTPFQQSEIATGTGTTRERRGSS